MAWNEPGGSGGKDPWGNRQGDDGPPDLDEVVRKIQNKFGGVFGGRGGGGGGRPSKGFGAGGIIFVVFIAFLVWALSGIYIVQEGERGVVLQFGEYHTTTAPGPHWYPRFVQTVYTVNVDRIRSVDLGLRTEDALMLTQDENIVDIKFAVQYKVKDPHAYLFNVEDPDQTLAQVTESAVREVVGKSKMDFVLTGGRSEVVARSEALVQETLDTYKTGLLVTKLTMQNAQAPDQVQDAFADAVKAREDEERLKNEAEAYANDILPKARGQAARVLEEAQAYKESVIAGAQGETARFLSVLEEYKKAPRVTRKRLYLDAMESVLGNSSKVLVDTDSGNSNLLYLPLDKLMQRQGNAGAAMASGIAESGGSSGSGSNSSANTSSSRMRENMRRREVR